MAVTGIGISKLSGQTLKYDDKVNNMILSKMTYTKGYINNHSVKLILAEYDLD